MHKLYFECERVFHICHGLNVKERERELSTVLYSPDDVTVVAATSVSCLFSLSFRDLKKMRCFEIYCFFQATSFSFWH